MGWNLGHLLGNVAAIICCGPCVLLMCWCSRGKGYCGTKPWWEREEYSQRFKPQPLPTKRQRRLTMPLPSSKSIFPKTRQRNASQTGSLFFTKLPLEIRRLIYQEFLDGETLHIHVSEPTKTMSHTNCTRDKSSSSPEQGSELCWGCHKSLDTRCLTSPLKSCWKMLVSSLRINEILKHCRVNLLAGMWRWSICCTQKALSTSKICTSFSVLFRQYSVSANQQFDQSISASISNMT